MTRTTPELALPSPNFHELGALRPQSRDLTARPPRPYLVWEIYTSGRGGLVVRSRPWGRWVPGSRPDSTEDPPCMGASSGAVLVI
ncbi:hypothetical protein AVEN_69100-1 [Araneus ventricosus]|uniref:Uncharacterized protein n=1 Tax=Araneus ventricosus TaxID=182803 RepID=A0A4Y2HLZ6_ARAVE|nr:hypothetical protein AVEN_69100-1 [Araneus ventricosus]